MERILLHPKLIPVTYYFVCMGAFTDLLNPTIEPIPIGFGVKNTVTNKNIVTGVPTAAEIAEFGIVEELLGRLPMRCRYNELSENSLYKILTESSISPVYDFERLFREAKNELTIDKSALREIALRAYEVKLGARGLRTVMGEILYPILYSTDGIYTNHEIRITKATLNGEKPVIKRLPTPIERLKEQDPAIWEKVMEWRREREKKEKK